MNKKITALVCLALAALMLLCGCGPAGGGRAYEKKLVNDGLICVVKNDKYGYVDKKGNVKIDFIYDYAQPFVDGKAIVKIGSGRFIIDTNGKTVSEKYDGLTRDGETGLYFFYSGEKVGLLGSDGKKVIKEALFDAIYPFSEGLAAVRLSGKYGYVNEKGDIVVDLKYDEAGRFTGGRAAVMERELYGFIDKSGKPIVDALYTAVSDFSGENAVVKTDSTIGVINKKGDRIMSFSKDEVSDVTCAEDLIFVSREDVIEVYGTKGNPVFDVRTSGNASTYYCYRQSVIVVFDNGAEDIASSAAFYNSKGKVLKTFNNAVSSGSIVEGPDMNAMYIGLEFSDSAEYTNGKKVFKVSGGKVNVKPIETDIYEFSLFSYKDCFIVRDDNTGKYGVKTAGGKVVLESLYDRIDDLTFDGYILYYNNGKYGVKDMRGNTVLNADYDKIVIRDDIFSGNNDDGTLAAVLGIYCVS